MIDKVDRKKSRFTTKEIVAIISLAQFQVQAQMENLVSENQTGLNDLQIARLNSQIFAMMQMKNIFLEMAEE
jgi:hypothetical protein